jgi:hypothetical protein
MARQNRDDGTACGKRPSALFKFVAAVFAVACIVGSARALTWNVGTKRIVAPPGGVDSGTAVVPSAVIINPGDSTASFPVVFNIGTFYTDTQNVTDLAHGDSVTVSFDPWVALQRGVQTVRCSTELAADESTANDRVTRTDTVRVRDIGVDSIITPKGKINLGVAVTPQARVTNHGTGTAMYWARFLIGTTIRESSFVFSLAPGASQTVSFTSWTPESLGTFTTLCTLALFGGSDMVPGNDWKQDSFTVVTLAKDAGALRVVAPTGVVDSGAVFAPQAMVRNFGTDAASFPAIFKIGTTYADTQQVTNLPSLDSTLVTFANWTASPPGTFTTRCSTALANDSNAINDKCSDSVKVIIRTTDVGAVRFIALPDTVDSGTVVVPQVVVYNYGLNEQSFPVKLVIGTYYTTYADTQQVTNLESHESLTVTFKNDTVRFRGSNPARCSTMLAGDQVTANDRVVKNIFQRVRDIGVFSITAPIGVVPQDTVVTPTATLWNYGNGLDSFAVIFRIGTFYADTIRTLDSTYKSVTFRPCTLNVAGTFSVECTTAMAGDVGPTNDYKVDSVQVTYTGISATDQGSGLPRTVTLRGSGPFAGRVAIEYGLPRSAAVRLEVYDACGRLVQVVAAGVGQPGYHTAVWKCTDEHGKAVAEGAYFVRLVADGKTLTSKLVKME